MGGKAISLKKYQDMHEMIKAGMDRRRIADILECSTDSVYQLAYITKRAETGDFGPLFQRAINPAAKQWLCDKYGIELPTPEPEPEPEPEKEPEEACDADMLELIHADLLAVETAINRFAALFKHVVEGWQR